MDDLLYKKFWKAKTEILKDKIKFSQCRCCCRDFQMDQGNYSKLARYKHLGTENWLSIILRILLSRAYTYLCINRLLPPIRAAEIVECVRKYVDGISQYLQSLSLYEPGPPRCFCSYGLWLNKSNHRVKQTDFNEPTNRY